MRKRSSRVQRRYHKFTQSSPGTRVKGDKRNRMVGIGTDHTSRLLWNADLVRYPVEYSSNGVLEYVLVQDAVNSDSMKRS